MHINPLQANVPILIPLKTEQWLEWINLFECPISIHFSDVFRRYRNGTLA